jgi:hypothetical protein
MLVSFVAHCQMVPEHKYITHVKYISPQLKKKSIPVTFARIDNTGGIYRYFYCSGWCRVVNSDWIWIRIQ